MIFVPIILSSLLLAAHFLRFGNFAGIAISLLLPLLLLIRRTWAIRIVQAGSFIGFLVWLSALGNIILERLTYGQPWGKAAIIMVSVALFTLIAALLLEHPAAKRYRLS